MPEYKALQSFPLGKRKLAVGEAFELDEKFGRVLVKIGRAEVVETDMPAEVKAMEAPRARAAKSEPLTEVEKPAAPLYRTRHMEAEKPKAKRGRPAGKAKRSQS